MPRDLLALVGKREELQTLRTKDSAEARVRYARVSAEVETRWANLRAGSRSLTEREAHSLAMAVHDAWLDWHSDEPSQQFTWHTQLYRRLWTQIAVARDVGDGETASTDELFVQNMRRFCFTQADNCLTSRGLIVDPDSRLKLSKAIGAAFQRASMTLGELAEGTLIVDEVPVLATAATDRVGTTMVARNGSPTRPVHSPGRNPPRSP